MIQDFIQEIFSIKNVLNIPFEREITEKTINVTNSSGDKVMKNKNHKKCLLKQKLVVPFKKKRNFYKSDSVYLKFIKLNMLIYMNIFFLCTIICFCNEGEHHR